MIGKYKGISLVIETVIVLVLAVIVLSVLLLFFHHFFGPGQTILDLEREKNELCIQYIKYDKDCSDSSKVDSSLVGKLVSKCRSLSTKQNDKYPCCAYDSKVTNSDLDEVTACISQCCELVCPAKNIICTSQ